MDLHQYVSKSTDTARNLDAERPLAIKDFEDLKAHGDSELNIFEDEVPLKIVTSKPIPSAPIPSEFSSEPLSCESVSLESASPKRYL